MNPSIDKYRTRVGKLYQTQGVIFGGITAVHATTNELSCLKKKKARVKTKYIYFPECILMPSAHHVGGTKKESHHLIIIIIIIFRLVL